MDKQPDRRGGYHHVQMERVKGISVVPALEESLECERVARDYLRARAQIIGAFNYPDDKRVAAWEDYDNYGGKLTEIARLSDKGELFPDADGRRNENVVPITLFMHDNLKRAVLETREKLKGRFEQLMQAGIAYSTRLSEPFKAVKNKGFSYWINDESSTGTSDVNGDAVANLTFTLKYLDGKYEEISQGIRKPSEDDLKKLGIDVTDIPEEEIELWGEQDVVNHYAEKRIIEMILHNAGSSECNPLEIMSLIIAEVNRVLNHGKSLADEKLTLLKRNDDRFEFEKTMGNVEGIFFVAKTGAQLARIVNIIARLRGSILEEGYYEITDPKKVCKTA